MWRLFARWGMRSEAAQHRTNPQNHPLPPRDHQPAPHEVSSAVPAGNVLVCADDACWVRRHAGPSQPGGCWRGRVRQRTWLTPGSRGADAARAAALRRRERGGVGPLRAYAPVGSYPRPAALHATTCMLPCRKSWLLDTLMLEHEAGRRRTAELRLAMLFTPSASTTRTPSAARCRPILAASQLSAARRLVF